MLNLATPAIAPLLVFGWGNPSRGDDALGPMLLEQLETRLAAQHWVGVQCLTDFQLQVEHALDLGGRQRVLFVDASLRCAAPFEITRLTPARDHSFTSHAMSPQAVMQVFRELHGRAPPPCNLLAIRGERFELGEPPTAVALAHLTLALAAALHWLAAQAPTQQDARADGKIELGGGPTRQNTPDQLRTERRNAPVCPAKPEIGD
ncbi:hydrogenase maturation protease [Rhodoferax sp.]|uniref:hydrogenase maturation protease n=1 Tax=Rhodoferax sp. TaxID=50421 RepID=UPI00275088FE|nr:hydrogenase maturation protease [Rhodoferax sp.]